MASVGPVRTSSRSPARIRATAGLAVIAVIVVLAGCATVPSGGAPQLVKSGGNQVQAYLQQLPPPGPQAYHKPDEVVYAFLHASASYAFDPAAVRQFLVPTLRAKWHPRPVTVLSSIGNASTPRVPLHSQQNVSSAAGQSVELTGQRLAILSPTGQYQYSPSPRASTYPFSLQKVHGVWLISALPPGPDSLLLLQSDFEHVYQARNLFFFARPPSPADSNLVPDAVYAPLQSSNTNLASGLVKGLLSDQHSWLSGATETAFPRGTSLRSITISGQTAVVDLGGAAAHTSALQQQAMAEQLQATLASSPALARFLQLEIYGRTVATIGSANLIDDVLRGPLVYQSAQSSISEGLGSQPQSVGPAEFGSATITAVAMSPVNTPQAMPVAVAAEDGNGCQVYLLTLPTGGQGGGSTGSNHRVRISTSSGKCTSLSWDNNGYLWAAAGQKVWVLPPQSLHPQPVALPAHLPSRGKRAPQIIALRMAPDAVRAALLIKSGAHDRLLLAAVHEDHNQVSLGNAIPAGIGLQDPTAMSWFSPYDLMVLDDSAIAEVPLTGGSAERLGSAPPGADSLTTDGVTFVVGTHVAGTSDYKIWTSSTLASTWHKTVTGAIPIYPG